MPHISFYIAHKTGLKDRVRSVFPHILTDDTIIRRLDDNWSIFFADSKYINKEDIFVLKLAFTETEVQVNYHTLEAAGVML